MATGRINLVKGRFHKLAGCLSLLLSLFLFAQQAQAARQKSCPSSFTCGPSGFAYGYYLATDSNGQDKVEAGGALLAQSPATELANLPTTTAGGSSNAVALSNSAKNLIPSCIGFCTDYTRQSAASGGDFAAYYTLWVYASFGSSGVPKYRSKCLCYSTAVCSSNGRELYEDKAEPVFLAATPGVWSIFLSGAVCSGGVVGDPHFTGADNSHFDFTGVPNHYYSLLSDRDLQVNAFFGGRYDAPSQEGQPGKPMTWMRKVGVMFRRHSLVLEAREGPQWQYGSGYMQRILVDNHPVSIDFVGESADFTFADGTEMKVTWVLAEEPSGDDVVDKYEVRLGKVATIILTIRPEVAALRTADDGVVHFGLTIAEAKLSADAHGVLGQTFRPDFVGRWQAASLVWNELLQKEVVPSENAEGFIDGTPDDYMVSSLLSWDCEVCRYQEAHSSAVAVARKMLR